MSLKRFNKKFKGQFNLFRDCYQRCSDGRLYRYVLYRYSSCYKMWYKLGYFHTIQQALDLCEDYIGGLQND